VIPRNPDPWRAPTVDLSELSKAQRRAYVIADNRLPEDATWDFDALRLELPDLSDMKYDLSHTGFDGEEILRILRGDDEEGPEAPSSTGPVENTHQCPQCGFKWSDE
jgi:hypothetical protein